ncbi:MAG TPA: CRTAC1 family protein [Fimbriiglobus sp.]|jgi:hypothetical protein
MFTDVSHLVAPLPPGRYSCAAVCDVDGDGQQEIFLGRLDGPNRVLKWVGGMLRDVTPPTLADPVGPAVACAAADVNGDGREEIFVATAGSSADRLFLARTDGTWHDLYARPENRSVRNLAPGLAVAALDRRGVGRYGFVVSVEDQPLKLYEFSPDGMLSDLAPTFGLDRFGDLRYLHPGPIVTSRTDLFGSKCQGSNVLLVPQSAGTYDDVAGRYGLADAHERCTAAVFVTSGKQLGLVTANCDGPHRHWVRQSDGTFQDRATPAFAFPSEPRALVAADFDNDGAEEVLFLNPGESNRLFRLAPDWRIAELGSAANSPGYVTVAVAADLDGDGRIELLLAFSNDPTIQLFRTVGPDRTWLRIEPLTRFGAPARGATVTLVTADRIQIRVISGTGSIEPVAHFGLGYATAFDRVTITWPDGATISLAKPTPRQHIRVPYPGG